MRVNSFADIYSAKMQDTWKGEKSIALFIEIVNTMKRLVAILVRKRKNTKKNKNVLYQNCKHEHFCFKSKRLFETKHPGPRDT